MAGRSCRSPGAINCRVRSLGFHAVAPDMRGYGRSSVYPRHQDYAVERITATCWRFSTGRAVSGGLGRPRWGGRSFGIASTIPALPGRRQSLRALLSPGLHHREVVPLVDRWFIPRSNSLQPMGIPAFLPREFRAARAAFESNPRYSESTFRAGDPAGKGKPARSALIRAKGGWFGAAQTAPDLPRVPW